MGNFNRDNNRDNKRSSGGFNRDRGFNNGKRFGQRDGGRPMMHKAVCTECGASCEIPFKPTGDRPVFCSKCFEKQGGGNRPNRFGGERHDRPFSQDKQMFSAVCDKCGKQCQVPFRPTSGKPVFCNNCFEKGGNNGNTNKDSGEIMQQIKILNVKMDKLMNVLLPKVLAEKIEKKEIKKEIVKAKNKIKPAVKKSPSKKKK